MLFLYKNGCTNAPQCYVIRALSLLLLLTFKMLRLALPYGLCARAPFPDDWPAEKRNVTTVFTPQWTAAEHRVLTSTWPVGVHSLQAAIWLPFHAVQASTVVAAVCSNLVTKASQSITQLRFSV
jgi:hypothetical protein